MHCPERGTVTSAVVSGFFVAPMTSAPLAILSTPDCGGEGEKRFSLTQGGRLHEGSAPSDKRPDRLMVGMLQRQILWVDK
jgi:outer membrane protein assembly factor BamE (lipoprotein component of BamABCDE complex)